LRINCKKKYDLQRQQAYPEVSEQLDMLWHSMNSGSTPKSEPFFSAIEKIKMAFPKERKGN